MPGDKVIVMGAAGRDFHNFNVYFRNNDAYEVVAFTTVQIPDMAGRVYPPELASTSFPQGIPLYAETELARLISELEASQVILANSDVSREYVLERS
jgi:predicted GTPase